MKAAVTFDVRLTVEISGAWEKGCTLEQVQAQAEREARGVVDRLMRGERFNGDRVGFDRMECRTIGIAAAGVER